MTKLSKMLILFKIKKATHMHTNDYLQLVLTKINMSENLHVVAVIFHQISIIFLS